MSAAGSDTVPDCFAKDGYVVVRHLLPEDRAEQYRKHLIGRVVSGKMRIDDPQVPGAPSFYGDPVLESLMEELLPAVEASSGRRLWPTYSYARLYRTGDELKPHRDRPACEISVSLNLGQTPSAEPWALNLEVAGSPVAVLLMPGDALLYRGIDLTHWREPYRGKTLSQVFLHYVDQDGPRAGQKYDRRAALGLPPVPPEM